MYSSRCHLTGISHQAFTTMYPVAAYVYVSILRPENICNFLCKGFGSPRTYILSHSPGFVFPIMASSTPIILCNSLHNSCIPAYLDQHTTVICIGLIPDALHVTLNVATGVRVFGPVPNEVNRLVFSRLIPKTPDCRDSMFEDEN